jgi:hypothetical protein
MTGSAFLGRAVRVNRHLQEDAENAFFGSGVVRSRLMVDLVCGLVRAEDLHPFERLR